MQNCPASMLQQFMPNVTAPTTPRSCFNSNGFLWVARPDSRAGTRPKRHAVLKFPFLAFLLVPAQQRLTVFLCLPPTATFRGVVAGTGIRQCGVFSLDPALTPETVDGDLCATAGILPAVTPPCGQRVGAESFSLSELKGAKIKVPEPCALSTDVDGARRFENTGLYHVPKLHGELDGAGDPPAWLLGVVGGGRARLRCR